MMSQQHPQAIATDGLASGFADPTFDAQRVFRRILDAMARPGTIASIDADLTPPAPLAPGCAAICLALADLNTPLWLDAAMSTEAAARYLRFHCGARIVPSSRDARFALIADGTRSPALAGFDAGDDEYPERSATLLIQVRDLRAGDGWRLVGPGIDDHARLAVDGLSDAFWPQWQLNHGLFPQGVDIVFVAGSRIAALPRTTEVKG